MWNSHKRFGGTWRDAINHTIFLNSGSGSTRGGGGGGAGGGGVSARNRTTMTQVPRYNVYDIEQSYNYSTLKG